MKIASHDDPLIVMVNISYHGNGESAKKPAQELAPERAEGGSCQEKMQKLDSRNYKYHKTDGSTKKPGADEKMCCSETFIDVIDSGIAWVCEA